jgi:hypothetical protein
LSERIYIIKKPEKENNFFFFFGEVEEGQPLWYTYEQLGKRERIGGGTMANINISHLF